MQEKQREKTSKIEQENNCSVTNVNKKNIKVKNIEKIIKVL